MSQLAFDGSPVPPGVRVTARQRLAVEYVAAKQPVPSDELGAVLHADRLARGGRGHSVDERCEWCRSEGREMGAALRRLGLVRERRGAGWVLEGAAAPPRAAAPAEDVYDPATADFPEGF